MSVYSPLNPSVCITLTGVQYLFKILLLFFGKIYTQWYAHILQVPCDSSDKCLHQCALGSPVNIKTITFTPENSLICVDFMYKEQNTELKNQGV